MDKEAQEKIASMVWAFAINLQMRAEGSPLRYSPEDFGIQRLINKNPYLDFAQQIIGELGYRKLPEGKPPLLSDEEIEKWLLNRLGEGNRFEQFNRRFCRDLAQAQLDVVIKWYGGKE